MPKPCPRTPVSALCSLGSACDGRDTREWAGLTFPISHSSVMKARLQFCSSGWVLQSISTNQFSCNISLLQLPGTCGKSNPVSECPVSGFQPLASSPSPLHLNRLVRLSQLVLDLDLEMREQTENWLQRRMYAVPSWCLLSLGSLMKRQRVLVPALAVLDGREPRNPMPRML